MPDVRIDWRDGALKRMTQGYRRFQCRVCGKQFNERSGSRLNWAQGWHECRIEHFRSAKHPDRQFGVIRQHAREVPQSSPISFPGAQVGRWSMQGSLLLGIRNDTADRDRDCLGDLA